LCTKSKVVLPLLHFNKLLVQYLTMSASSSIALVFGAGQNVGAGVVKAFSAKGYRIATVSRTATEDASDKLLHIQADLEDPESVSAVFATVRKQLGHPSVVVYNGQLLGLFVAICFDADQGRRGGHVREQGGPIGTFSQGCHP
jgi:NAD(P)-dependent dehydrogenase (short-subunit alcohol dehydrogenase family)